MELRIWKYACQRKRFYALGGIEEVEVLLHRHVFGCDNTYTELEERLGNKIYETDDKSKNYRSGSYRRTGWVGFNKKKLRLFWSRKYPSLPPWKIEISSPGQEYLARLNEALPNLELDLIEYTVDLYCSNWIAVRSLFKVLVRYSYVPWTKAHHLDLHRGSNRTYYSKDLRVYERGDDETGLRPGWNRRDVNRVRVEFIADSEILEKYGMVSLEDLIRDGHFERIFPRVFHFKVFMRSGQLPKENDKYALLEQHECFQKQLIEAREQGILNPTQYISDAPGFDKLKKRVVRKIRKFDRDWRVTYRNILTNQISRTGRRNVHS